MNAEVGDPPSKRPRLEPPEDPGTPMDDMDDLYGTPNELNTPQKPPEPSTVVEKSSLTAQPSQPDVIDVAQQTLAERQLGGIPGLGLLGDESAAIEGELTSKSEDGSVQLGSTTITRENGDPGKEPAKPSSESNGGTKGVETTAKPTKAELDPAFIEAAQQNSANENAEWHFDASDAASSSSDDTSSSDSDSSDDSDEEEDDYELLDPEEQVRILMQGEGGSEDEGGERKGAKAGAGAQLRTKNEVAESRVEKLDVTVTADMKVEELGAVQSIVENLLVIKAKVSGEYQVLEAGSVLCLQDRNVIGAVAETLGSVQQPYYSVRFNNAEELSQAGIAIGTAVYYVEEHSTYVLTRPLQAIKGSDASNLHDEEVGEDDLEFSDDEAEAEHKRRAKQERQARRGAKLGLGGGASTRPPPRSTASLGLNYDDTPHQTANDDDDLYTPLARPSNLHEMMSGGQPPPELRSFQGNANSGQNRGRGRDRGRGGQRRPDRGRGRGNRGRGQSGFDRRDDGNVHAVDSRSGPDKLSSRRYDQQQHAQPMQKYSSSTQQYSPPAQHSSEPYSPQASHLEQSQPHQYSTRQPQQQQQQQQTYPPSPYSWPPQQAPGGAVYPPFQPLQQGQHEFVVPPPPLASPGGTFPPGSFINPSFFYNQQMQMQMQPAQNIQSQWSPPAPQQYQQHQQQYSYPPQPPSQSPPSVAPTPGGRMSPEADAAFRAAQEKLEILRGLNRAGSGSP